ncbi:MAG: hypothetical protein V4732_07375 [Pseudomonadota bacterium]
MNTHNPGYNIVALNDFTIAMVEQHLSQQGNYCLLDWLLQQNRLAYSAYEAWRYGQIETLDTRLGIGNDELQNLIVKIEQHGKALGLVNEPHDYFKWAENNQKPLVASTTVAIHRALTQHWLRAQDVPQLDLFMDNSAVICENEIHAVLAGRQFELAQKKLQRLTALNAKHPKLGNYQDLVNYGLHMQTCTVVDAVLLANEITALEQEVLPLASETLGASARDYIAFAWRRLSQSAQTIAFDSQQIKLHCSYALMQIPDWTAALGALRQEPELFVSASLLQRLALCHERLQHHNEAMIAWCLLFECDSNAVEAACEAKVSPQLWALWEDFWDINDGGAKSFFPAFVFIKNPGLVHHLHKFPAFNTNSSKAMIDLMKIHIAGGNEIDARKALQNISPALLRLYLNGCAAK